MKKEIMAKDRPIGLVIFSVLLALAGLSAIKVFFSPDANLIFLNYLISGVLYKVYNLAYGVFILVIAYGLLELKRWAYTCFAILTAYSVFTSFLNSVFTKSETLTKSGWILSENSTKNYDLILWVSIIISLLMFYWVHRYRQVLIE